MQSDCRVERGGEAFPSLIVVQGYRVAEQVERGECLARSAAMVGDRDDFHAWRAHRNAWIKATFELLDGALLPAEASAFREAVGVTDPPSGWQAALAEDVQRVKRAVAVLRALDPDVTLDPHTA